MGFRIDVRVVSWIQLPVLSGHLHRLTSRFFLNLRNVATYRPQITSGTRSLASTVAAPRLTREQSGLPITDFIVDMSIDNNNETDTKEGAIQQVEIFHLEVISSRNWHNGEKHDLGAENAFER